ncbi:MAG: EAL domain-containing protein [Desulfuromusa sp.]|nr:EAL domain-containing protein [Desulfuromusa sp.]
MQGKIAEDILVAKKTDQPHILIVDDQLSLLLSLQALLQINGYRVELARSGGEAITKLQDTDYQLLLLDLQMPGIDGLEVLEFVRQAKLDLETIVVSGETSFTSIKDAMRLGAYDFIRKPYNPEELLTTVSRGIEHYRETRRVLQTKHSLGESEQLHRFIVNNSPDFIYMLDTQGIFTYVNAAVEELLGYKRHELLGRHFSSIIHPHNASEIHNFFSEHRAGDRATHSIEIRLLANQSSEQVTPSDSPELIVELNAMGIYEEKEAGNKIFVGTLGSARDISERKISEEHISHQAYHDLLTQLPNRILFDDRINQILAHASRNQQKFAMLFMDLDRFKLINDTLGHVMGDLVLQQVSERILGCLRAEDTLSRFGGDEFCLLLPDISSTESVAAVAEKILKAVRQPFSINNHELYLSISLGIAIYPDAGKTGDALLQSSDIAMYQVKANGKDGYCFYSDTMRSHSSSLSVERDMSTALEKKQFQVFFQPKVDPSTHMIVGMEALLRWQHPERGLLYPGDFIATAETSKLMVPIGAWVLRSVCEEVVRWKQQGLPQIKISLNISLVQLRQDNFAEYFIKILQEFELRADLFEIEITEQGLNKGERDVAGQLRALRDYGVSVTIDNFGRGYSSLSYLQNFPVNTLKIDRSFVREIEEGQNQTCMADGIAMMAKGMNLNVVGAGVENLHQLDYLRNLGCHEVQGYLYSEAISAQETLNLLKNRPNEGPHFTLPN